MDTVNQLRKQATEIADAGHNGWGNTMLMAADEIERLRDALKFYATGEWADGYPGGVYVEGVRGTIIDTGEIARAALNTQR